MTSSMKPSQLIKDPGILNLKHGTLQGRAADPRTRVGTGAPAQMNLASLFRRVDPVPLTSTNGSGSGRESSVLCREPAPRLDATKYVE